MEVPRGAVSEERAALRAVKRNLLNLYCDSPVAPIAETLDSSAISYAAASEHGSSRKPAGGESAGQEAPALQPAGAQLHPDPADHAASGGGSRGLPPRAGGAPAGTGTPL